MRLLAGQVVQEEPPPTMVCQTPTATQEIETGETALTARTGKLACPTNASSLRCLRAQFAGDVLGQVLFAAAAAAVDFAVLRSHRCLLLLTDRLTCTCFPPFFLALLDLSDDLVFRSPHFPRSGFQGDEACVLLYVVADVNDVPVFRAVNKSRHSERERGQVYRATSRLSLSLPYDRQTESPIACLWPTRQ